MAVSDVYYMEEGEEPDRPVTRRPPPRRRGPRPMSAGDIVIVGALCLFVACLLNADSLYAMANREEIGSRSRSVALFVAKPLRSVSNGLHLTGPHRRIDALQGETDTSSSPSSPAAASPPTATADATTTTVAGDAASTTTVAGPTTVATTPLPTGPRVPTKDDMLRLYIAGDSQAGGFGQALEEMATKTGLINATLDFKVSTGLTRPDALNWPKRLHDEVATLKPDVVVVDFGGNDTQGIITPEGKTIGSVTDPAWAIEYAKRVAAVMDEMSAESRKLIWVGTPNAENGKQTEQLAVIRAVYQQEAAKRPQVTFVDTWAAFESPQGLYASVIVIDGDAKVVRQQDGFHLNPNGATYLGRIIETEVEKEVRARGGQI